MTPVQMLRELRQARPLLLYGDQWLARIDQVLAVHDGDLDAQTQEARETLLQEGWAWDGEQWQRPADQVAAVGTTAPALSAEAAAMSGRAAHEAAELAMQMGPAASVAEVLAAMTPQARQYTSPESVAAMLRALEALSRRAEK